MCQSNEYNQNEGIVHKNQFHIVFCPKYRRKVLVQGVDVRLKELLYATAKDNDCVLTTVEIMPDQVHLFVEIDPRRAVHSVVRIFKGNTSRILREEYPWLKMKIPSLWTRSYFCCTVGHPEEEMIQQYINNQKEQRKKGVSHERTKTSQSIHCC